MDDLKLQQVIEGALLAAGHALKAGDIQELFEVHEKPEKDQVEAQFLKLQEFYDGRGLELVEVASGWRFQVRKGLSEWVGRLFDEKPQRYTRATLETLALIAYRQPITRGEIEDVRGVVVSSNIIRSLLEREWIKIVGHRDVPGRPALFATTREFLDYFDLKGIDELPPLAELKDMSSANEELELEGPVEEGNFDFSHKETDATESEAQLASADEDIRRAEAMVAQVEENVFKAKEDAEAEDAEKALAAASGEEPGEEPGNDFASLADAFAPNTATEVTKNTENAETEFSALANHFGEASPGVAAEVVSSEEDIAPAEGSLQTDLQHGKTNALSDMAARMEGSSQDIAPDNLEPSEQTQREALDKFLADGGVLDGTGDFNLADLLKKYTSDSAGDEDSGE